MTKRYVSVKGQLAHLNNVLARLQKAVDAVEAVQAAMHVAPHTEADKEARVLRRMLKKTGETAWEERTGKKQGTYKSAFSYKTFEVRKNKENSDKTSAKYIFRKKVNDAVTAIEGCRELLGSDSLDFSEKGTFNRTQSIVWVESALASRIGDVKSYMHEIKKEYNQSHELSFAKKDLYNALEISESPGKHSYLVELRSAMMIKDHGFDFFGDAESDRVAWLKQLRHNTTIDQRYQELLKASGHSDKALKKRDAEFKLFNEVVNAYKASKSLGDAVTDDVVMKALQKDLDDGKRVYINVKLNEKKDKYRETAVSMWTTLFSTVSTAGESVLGAYSVATALGAATGVGMMASLIANPALMAATIGIFLSVLVVNQSLFDKQVKDLFSMLAKGELFKNKDGSPKTTAEKALLVGGMFVAVVSGAMMAVLTYNSCIAAFSSMLALPATAPAVIAIALGIAAIEFVALTGFNFQFFNAMFSDLKNFSKTMNRLYFQGRSKTGKGFLFAANLMLTALFVMGSLVVGKSSLTDFFNSFNTSMPKLNWAIQGMSSAYYLSGSIVVMNAMIMAMRKKFSGMKRFFRNATAGQIAARIAIDVLVGLPKQVLFFAVTCLLATLRLVLNIVKIVAVLVVNASVVTGLPLLVAGIHALNTGQKFGKVLKQYTSAPQKAAESINKVLPAWNVMYRETLGKAGSLPILANSSSGAALSMNSSNAMMASSGAATQALLGATAVPSAGMKFAVSQFANTGARDEFIEGAQLVEGVAAREDAKDEAADQYCPKRYITSMFAFGQSKNQIGDDVRKLIDLGKKFDDGPKAGA